MKKVVSKKNTNEIDVTELTPDMIIVREYKGNLYLLKESMSIDAFYFVPFYIKNDFICHFSSFDSFKSCANQYNLYVLDDIREISEIPRD